MDKEQAEFARQVRDAVVHLYDHAYLQRHPLALRLVPPEAEAAHTRGQELRRILLDAIETLKPGSSVARRAPERRPYAILFGLYVAGRSQSEVAESLAISTRQLRRDRASAFAALVEVLSTYHPAPAPPSVAEPLRIESLRLAQEREPIDLCPLVQGILPLLESVARERGVELATQVEQDLPQPCSNRTLVRQVLIGLASQTLAALPLARLSFTVRQAQAAIAVGLRLEYRVACATAGSSPLAGLTSQLQTAETLAAALGGRLQREPAGDRSEMLWVYLPLQEKATVLVVDDNHELFSLFERFVVGQPYRLVHATGTDQALDLARSIQPQAITVDLMMPRRDGWELLQALRADPATAGIPVIVCSVLEEPQLALSLGAQNYLKKPVGQVDLLNALGAAVASYWEREENRGGPEDNPTPGSR